MSIKCLKNFRCIFAIAIFFVFIFGVTNCQQYREVKGRKQAWIQLTVDHSGKGNFTTVQSAIDSIPPNNKFWVAINIKPGTYREKVIVPHDKPYIILKGGGKRNTFIVWDDHYHDSLRQSATFIAEADNFVARDLSFANFYNLGRNSRNRNITRAVAALILGDKTSFFRCGFYGVQDTLWDSNGRHYFKRCTFWGAVDFIFGAGQSLYESCGIRMYGEALPKNYIGFITAQGRSSSSEANGFVFKNCNIYGSGSAYLGRAWRGYSRVIFYHTNFSSVVHPKGWDAWSFSNQEDQLTYAEHRCFGTGADTSERVSWANKLNSKTVTQFASLKFIDREGWLKDQPWI